MTDITIHPTERRRPRPSAGELGFGSVFTDHMFVMEFTEPKGWHDPRIVGYGPLTLDPAAAVFHYGQAMFEGTKAFRCKDGEVRLFRAGRHAARLAEGTRRICMPSVDVAFIERAVTALVRMDRDWVPAGAGTALYLRPTLIATEPFLGVRASRAYTFFVIASPVGAYYAEGIHPVRIRVEQHETRAARGGLGAVKTGANYLASLHAAEQAQKDGYAQVLWLDAGEKRFVEEVGTMNFFVRIGEELVTPPLSDSILSGVTRDCVLTLARHWGLAVHERPLALDEIVTAHRTGALKEAFGSGTAAVIAPVGELSIGRETLSIGGGQIGKLAGRLYQAISGIQRGEEPDEHGWLSAPV